MVKELIHFTKNLSEDFKRLGIKPKEGLHILLGFDENNKIILKNHSFYTKKIEEDELIEKTKSLSHHAWCIDTGKCLDLPAKGIHACSPFCVAFKMEFLEGGGKNSNNKEKNLREINSRLAKYFDKAFALLEDADARETLQPFREVFTVKTNENYFETIIANIMTSFQEKRANIDTQMKNLQQFDADNKKKDAAKEAIEALKKELLKYKALESSDYVIFYLDKSLEEYKKAHQVYLGANLFLYKDKFITEPNEENLTYGVNAFMNSFNGNMPFLTHQTAAFDISGRLSNIDVKHLYDFEQVLSGNILPRTLPIFIFKEELQDRVVGLFKDSGFKLGYKETIEKLWGSFKDDFGNYYLLNWQNTKEGLVFMDFDFVSKFEYEFDAQIENLFELKEKDKKDSNIHYAKITNIFELEQTVFKSLLQSKYLKLDYFGELKKEDYDGLANTFQAFAKYRKAVYDFVYKSNRQSIDGKIFYDMVFSHIKDDIKHNRGYSIKEKLNIWFSIYEKFNFHIQNNTPTMASNLKNYQEFVSKLAVGQANAEETTDVYFAFAAGQVIEYVLQKSESADNSFRLLEPYLQQAKCQEFKRAIANDIARYKHAIERTEYRFEKVAEFVLTYSTNVNMKELLPEILAGIFSRNQFFEIKIEKKETK